MAEDPGSAIAATEAAIAALESQRAALGDAVADAALAPLRERLAALRATPEKRALRRQVTVLFLDIVGSTALGQRLDPEDLHESLDGLLADATQIVNAHGGRVLQYAGDNLLATFGGEADATPQRDGAAERAVRCALALREEGRHFGERMLAQHRHPGCNVRLGLHTGPVLLGAGVDEAQSIRGFAVHLAARMEQSAPPGSIRISHDTWLLVRGAFQTEAQPPLQVKGHAEPLRTHLVLAELPRGFEAPGRGVEGLQAPLIGRDAELQALATLLAAALVQRRPQAATLEGEPGVGKSRLLQEWRAALATAGHRLLLARAQPALQQQPFGLLRALVLGHLGIVDSDAAGTACARLVAGVAPALGAKPQATAQAHALGQLLGLPFGESPHVRGLEATLLLRAALQALQAWLRSLVPPGAALVLLLEDLHWADDDSLDTLATLLATAEATPLLLVGSTRPELRARRAGWPEGVPQHHRLALAELGSADRARLADALLAPLNTADPALRALLTDRSDGNPFFMEELLRMLLDHGVLVQEGAAWQVHPERLQQARLPTTLVEVLQARLDALQPAERRALQQASIVGPVFWQGTLAAIDASAPAALPALHDKGLLDDRAPSAFEDTPESAFHHHVLQQVAYDSVLRAARRQGHAAVARWLADRAGDRAGEHLATTAQHYEQAGELGAACEWYRRAAAAATERGAFRAALAQLEAALRCTAADDLAQRFDLHLSLNNAADALGERDTQQAFLEEAERLVGQLQDPARHASVTFSRALLASRRGRENEALALAREAAALAAGGVAPMISSQAHAQMAWSRLARGEYAEALALADTAVAEGRRAAAEGTDPLLPGELGKVLAVRAHVFKAGHHHDRAHADLDEALAIADAAGLRRLRLNLLQIGASVDFNRGALESALARYRHALALAGSVGTRVNPVTCGVNIAHILMLLHRLPEAEKAIQGLHDEARRCGAQELLGRIQILASDIAAAAGRHTEAEAEAQAAEITFEALERAALVSLARARAVLAALARGDTALALVRAERLWASMGPCEGLLASDGPALGALACLRAFEQVGDARAAEALAMARAPLLEVAQRCREPARGARRLTHPYLNAELVLAWAARAETA